MSSGDPLGIIPTKAMLLHNQNSSDFTAVVFEEKKRVRGEKKNKNPNLKEVSKRVDNADEEVFDIRKARNEVLKFGLSGFEDVEKQKVQVAMAIKLGAKPPKRGYKNYKVLQEERKRAKEEKAEQESFQTLGKKSTGEAIFNYKKFSKGRRKRKDDVEVLREYGKISTVDKIPEAAAKKRKRS
uniref:Uncharacterized protein n=1 Tax=Phlebotomus papatasi TaxID=29031 RepID=A0A1B0DJY8_PHLPP